jgi:hypothetical protein
MILLPGDANFSKELDKLKSGEALQSALHTVSAAKYYRERPQNEGKTIEDRSFVLIWEKEPVIAFQGALVSNKTTKDLLFYEIPINIIENKRQITKNAAKTFLKEISKINKEVNGVIWYQDYMENGSLSTLSRYLLMTGAKASPVFSQVIELKCSEQNIKSSIRKSYHSEINWGLRELDPFVLDATNISWEQMDAFRHLHIQESGRETRSEASWRRQFEMIKAKEAFAIFGYYKEKLVSAGFFMYSKHICYYAVSASRIDLFNKPLFHSLVWKAILHAKHLGCHLFEIGDQVFPNHPNDEVPNAKELGISSFKAGFGGETKMYLDLKLKQIY